MLFILILTLMTVGIFKSQSCKFLSHNLSPDDINILLNEHNRLRAIVATGQQPGQPSASNMKQMSWDEDLASEAQKWADQCIFKVNIGTSSQFSWVGQNLYLYSGSNLNLSQAVQAWYNEVGFPGFNSQNISPFKFNKYTGHYTQVVWADTYKLGCGLTNYRKGTPRTYIFLVCNYGPAGNVLGATMYKTGTPCSDCPNECSTQEGLCN